MALPRKSQLGRDWRFTLGWVVSALVGLGLSSAGCTPETAEPGLSRVEPSDWNVVLITLDTVRADALGAYGQALDTTPQLDRLAREGVLFEQVVTAAPHTLAAHASLMTGLYPFAHGARGNHGFILSPDNVTLAEILRDTGHRTRAEIAAAVLRSGTRIAQGFDEASTSGEMIATESESAPVTAAGRLRRSAENISARGIEFIEAHRDAPFLLWLHYFDAHLPYKARPADLARFPDRGYLAQVAALDREVGRVISAIEGSGLRDRTLVIVTSDHGEGLGEHDEPTHSYYVYESTIRVPLIFWGPPEIPTRRRVAEVVRTVDVLPTVLDWMDHEAPAGLHGRSLRGLMTGSPEPGPPRVAYGEAFDLYRIFGTTPLRLVREGRWKYIHSAKPELYDLEHDPDEMRDLSQREPAVAARLEEKLRDLLEASGPAPADAMQSPSRTTAAQLEALGYVEPPRSLTRLEDEVATLTQIGAAPGGLADHAERLSRAKGSIAAGRWDRALATLAPVRAVHPDRPLVLGLVAAALAGRGDETDAIATFERALVHDEDPCTDVRLDFARAYHRFGREYERIELLEDALSRCPHSVDFRNDLAWALATTSEKALRDGDLALALARNLIGQKDGNPDPNHLDTLAAALAAGGDFAAAAKAQTRAIGLLERAGAPPDQLRAYRASLGRYVSGARIVSPTR